MRRLAAIGVATLLGMGAAGSAAADAAEERFEKTFAFAPGQLLSLSNTNGDIFIEPWDRAELEVRARKRVKTRGGSAAEALEELRIDIDVEGGGIEIETVYPNWRRLFSWNDVSASVDYDIRLPRSADLDVRTVNGEIEITGMAGEIRLRSTNGGIAVFDSAGSVSASTTNGGIKVELDELSGEGMEFETTNGAIRVDLPATARASVNARTTNGSIDTDFAVAVRGTVRRNRLEGDINGGGPRIDLRTTNGSIRLRER